MEVKVRQVSKVQAELTLTNTAAEVEEAYQNVCKKASKNFRLPGFRKGKVPMEMIERQLGDSILNTVAEELAMQNIKECLETLDPAPSSLPQIKVKSCQRGQGAVFEGTYDLPIHIRLGQYQNLEITVQKPVVGEKSLEAELEYLRKENAFLVPRTGEAQLRDHVRIEVSIHYGDKMIFNDKDFEMLLGRNQLFPGIDKNIIGMSVGAKKSFQIKMDQNFPDPRYRGQELFVQTTLHDCRYLELPELDDEFARDQGEYESLAAFKQKLRSLLEERARSMVRQKSGELLFKKIIADSEVVLPEGLVQNEYWHRLEGVQKEFQTRLGKKEVGIEEIARLMRKTVPEFHKELRQHSESALRSYVVMKELAAALKIDVDQKDIQKDLKNLYGAEAVEEFMLTKAGDEKVQAELRAQLLQKKTLDWLYENTRIKLGKEVELAELQSSTSG